jgi:hypothetical protein
MQNGYPPDLPDDGERLFVVHTVTGGAGAVIRLRPRPAGLTSNEAGAEPGSWKSGSAPGLARGCAALPWRRSPKQRETSGQDAKTGTIIGRKPGSAGGLQHVIRVVPVNRNRLAEDAVERLPGDSQPRPGWAGKAPIPGHQIDMVNSGLHGERGQEIAGEQHVALGGELNVSGQCRRGRASSSSSSFFTSSLTAW